MSASELQACIARLCIDESFRKLFFLQPDILSEYQLEASEHEAVTRIDRHALDFFAGSLRNKRQKRIAKAYPGLFRLESAVVQHYYRRYYAIFTPHPGIEFREEVAAFGIFLWESLVDEPRLPPYARELVQFEQHSFLARTSVAAESPPKLPRMEIDLASRPSLCDGAAVLRLVYDIPALEETLLRDAPEAAGAAATPGEHAFVLFPPLKPGGNYIMRLNAPLALVLERCDGRNSAAEIVAAVEAALQASALTGLVLNALQHCMQIGIVRPA